jgi:WD40 repeat protein
VVTPDGRRVVSASQDTTLKVWDLATGRVDAMLVGHAATVTACAVTPDGQRVVSASLDRTLKVWDLATGACLLTHRANTPFSAVTATATAIIAGDTAGSVWFLDGPLSNAPLSTAPSALATPRRGMVRGIVAVMSRFVAAVLALVTRATGRRR